MIASQLSMEIARVNYRTRQALNLALDRHNIERVSQVLEVLNELWSLDSLTFGSGTSEAREQDMLWLASLEGRTAMLEKKMVQDTKGDLPAILTAA